MKLTSKKLFKASPQELWQIVHDPGNMPAYNPKCMLSESLPKYAVGQRFNVTYEMNNKQTVAIGELVAFESRKMVHFRYHYEADARIGTVDEVFSIGPQSNEETWLVHTVDFSNSTLPKWVKFLIGFLGRFGKSMGNGPIDGIAALLN